VARHGPRSRSPRAGQAAANSLFALLQSKAAPLRNSLLLQKLALRGASPALPRAGYPRGLTGGPRRAAAGERFSVESSRLPRARLGSLTRSQGATNWRLEPFSLKGGGRAPAGDFSDRARRRGRGRARRRAQSRGVRAGPRARRDRHTAPPPPVCPSGGPAAMPHAAACPASCEKAFALEPRAHALRVRGRRGGAERSAAGCAVRCRDPRVTQADGHGGLAQGDLARPGPRGGG
jgi:hypothetical protein